MNFIKRMTFTQQKFANEMNSGHRLLYAFVVIIFAAGILSSCASLRRLVIKEAFPAIEATERAILSEENEEIAKQSLPFAIKLAEGIYEYSPNPRYASKLSLLYAAYAFAYVDTGPYGDFDLASDEQILASRKLYEKSFAYAMRALEKEVKGFSKTIYEPSAVDATLAKVTASNAEALFWLNFSWAMILFSDLSDITVLAHTETIRKLSERVIALNADYYYGAPYAILMAYYGARSEAIGGNKAKAREYYDLAKQKSTKASLIPQYVYMRFVAIEQVDRKGFEAAYREIEQFSISDNKDFAFVNVFLKRKAKLLYEKRDLLF